MIVLENVTKSYNGQIVLKDFSYTFEKGKIYFVKGPSGIGKTTLLRIASGLEKPDAGRVYFRETPEFCIMFQEDRLLENYSAARNLEIVMPGIDPAVIRKNLEKLIPAEETDKPVSELSGGTKRRVAAMRALLFTGNILFMDEPFAGLDEENRHNVQRVIEELRGQRVCVIASHLIPEGAKAEFIELDGGVE